MEKYQHMRAFISAASEYNKHPSESAISAIQRSLGVNYKMRMTLCLSGYLLRNYLESIFVVFFLLENKEMEKMAIIIPNCF